MHGGTHSCKIYKPLPQQGLINRLSGIKSSNPFDTDSICDYASQAMLKEHGQPRPCSFKFVRLYVNSWDRGKRKNVVAYIYYRSQVSLLFFLFCFCCACCFIIRSFYSHYVFLSFFYFAPFQCHGTFSYIVRSSLPSALTSVTFASITSPSFR